MSDPLSQVRNSCDQSDLLDLLSKDRLVLRNFDTTAPPMSECARVGKRELSWAPWIDLVSDSGHESYLNLHNYEFAHEHIFFEASGDNIGWGDHGLFSENSSQFEYRMEETCYDGSLMRTALSVSSVAPPGFSPSIVARTSSLFGVNKMYGFLRNNCQDFVERVRQQYRFLAAS